MLLDDVRFLLIECGDQATDFLNSEELNMSYQELNMSYRVGERDRDPANDFSVKTH